MRAIEGCGFEEKKCRMQQKRCITAMSHATFQYQEVSSSLQLLDFLERQCFGAWKGDVNGIIFNGTHNDSPSLSVNSKLTALDVP
jgi:hypothetical protein